MGSWDSKGPCLMGPGHHRTGGLTLSLHVSHLAMQLVSLCTYTDMHLASRLLHPISHLLHPTTCVRMHTWAYTHTCAHGCQCTHLRAARGRGE